MVSAFKEKIARFHKRHVEGAYDHVLHAFALISAIPPLCFLTVDLNRYLENSALHHVQHRSSLILDAIALAYRPLEYPLPHNTPRQPDALMDPRCYGFPAVNISDRHR
jgi:hypothetical protein